jgi:hypothetical protein
MFPAKIFKADEPEVQDARDKVNWDEPLADVAARLELSGVDELVDKCFHDDDPEIPDFDAVKARLAKQATFADFSDELRRVFVNFLEGPKCGFHLEIEDSVDNDELFLQVACPIKAHPLPDGSSGVTKDDPFPLSPAEMLAEKYEMQAKMSEDSYLIAAKLIEERRGKPLSFELKCRHDKHMTMYPNWAPFNRESHNFYRSRHKEYPHEAHDDVTELKLAAKDPKDRVEKTRDTGKEVGSLFAPFGEIHLIRLVKVVIEDNFNLAFWKEAGLLNDFFPMHDHCVMEKVEKMLPSIRPTWLPFCAGNGFKPLPLEGENEKNIELVKDYLGEECGFYYDFIVQYTKSLLRPSLYAVLFKLAERCFENGEGGFCEVNDTYALYSRVIFALLISAWASHLCDDMGSRAAVLTLRWGQQEVSGAAIVNPEYNERADKHWGNFAKIEVWWKVAYWSFLGNFLTVLAMFWIIFMAGVLNYLGKDMKEEPWKYVHITKLLDLSTGHVPPSLQEDLDAETVLWGASLAPLLITINNRIIGTVWDGVARKIVEHENHKTPAEKFDSLACKLYVVYLFNWSYPYLYIAFLKKYTEGCDGGVNERDCTPELQIGLISFFKISALVDFVILFVNWAVPAYKVHQEIKDAREGQQYTYIEVQGKLNPPLLVLDEMTVFVVNFTFVCAFTYACPELSWYALVYNCIIGCYYTWTRLRLARRGEPVRCQGFPIWNTLMRFSMFFSCSVNAGMAAFVVQPVAGWTTTGIKFNNTTGDYEDVDVPDELNKFLFFGGLEHGLFLMVTLFMIIVPDIPISAVRRQEYNDDVENDLLDPQRKLGHRLKGLPEKCDQEELLVNVFSEASQRKMAA